MSTEEIEQTGHRTMKNMDIHNPTFGMASTASETAMAFLSSIGIPVMVVHGASGFCKGVEVVDGGLHVDPAVDASTLLHEAGHLAICPGKYRHHLSGDLAKGMETIFSDSEYANLEPDSSLSRALMQMSDTEATAWAWAAGRHLGLDDHDIIQSHEYDGDGASIRFMLQTNRYLGINGLQNAGFCVTRAHPYNPAPVYPELAFWLQEAA